MIGASNLSNPAQFSISTIDMRMTHSCLIEIRMDFEKQNPDGPFHSLKICIKKIYLTSQWKDDWCSSSASDYHSVSTLSGSKQTQRASRKVCAPGFQIHSQDRTLLVEFLTSPTTPQESSTSELGCCFVIFSLSKRISVVLLFEIRKKHPFNSFNWTR